MRRLLWLGIGLAVGGLVVRAVSRKVQAYSPGGIIATARESAGGLLDSARSFIDDVRDGMAEREAELHAALAGGMPLGTLEPDAPDPDQPGRARPDGHRQRSGLTHHLDDDYPQEGIR